MAAQVIESLAINWDPGDYHDTYRERVQELIKAKQQGDEVVGEGKPPEATNVVDLMEALEQSVQNARRDKKPGSAPKKRGGDLAKLTKAELYDRAGKLNISGRSRMNQAELRKAIGRAKSRKAS